MYSVSGARDETVLAVPSRHEGPGMKDPLVRFGVAIERSLLRDLDAVARARGCTRSELLRDLGRAEVGRAKVAAGVEAVGALTIVYDHHVRDLSDKLTDLQHALGDDVRAAMHVHLSHDLCLEVIVMRGRSDRLAAISDQILALRGVKQGGIEMIPAGDIAHGHSHGHDHPHGHDHSHEPAHPHPHPSPARRPHRLRPRT
jgi:CopG family nickel-responsive transcriptional regulator